MGMAGAIIATRRTYIDPGIAFSLNTSFLPVLMALFGGMGSLVGPVIGAALFTYIGELLLTRFPDLYMLIFGVVLILAIVFMPNGILGAGAGSLEQDERRSTCTCLKVKGSLKHFGGLAAVSERRLLRGPRRDTGTHRAQRRRQDHAVQPHLGCAQADVGQDHLQRAGDHRSTRLQDLPAWAWLGPSRRSRSSPTSLWCRNVMVGSLFGTGAAHKRGRGSEEGRGSVGLRESHPSQGSAGRGPHSGEPEAPRGGARPGDGSHSCCCSTS